MESSGTTVAGRDERCSPTRYGGPGGSLVGAAGTVLRRFYDVHRDAGTGPLLNPFPLDPAALAGSRTPQPDGRLEVERVGRFNKLFAALPSSRDRALVASAGVQVSELIGMRQRDVDPG
ncbi:hypothetical protein [Streptomyces sp. NPDC050422]|uniref:hypothetical protein n=1 Tax=Streptomyces sp. NPDC050422 TaxID=3365614 RepID=UPI003796C352